MTSEVIEPSAPGRRRLPWWAWLLILLASGVVIAIPALVILGMLSYVGHSVSETSPDQPFIQGALQQPQADAPLPCPDQCFAVGDAALLAVSSDDVSMLRIEDVLHDVAAFEPATVAEVAPAVGESWRAAGGDASCAFLPANAPYFAVGSDATSVDPISWVQTWQTGDEVMDIAAREFSSTDEASRFMLDLHNRVASCPWQDMNLPAAGGLGATLVQITPQAAIEVLSEVAAVGWVREGVPGPRWRSYVWDLQRGNLVVQVRVITDGRVLERDVAAFAEIIGARLAQLDPTPS